MITLRTSCVSPFFRALCCLALVTLALPNTASATLIGDTVSVALSSPNGTLNEGPDPVSFLEIVVVGAGQEVAAGGSSGLRGFMFEQEWIDFDASSISLRVGAGYEESSTSFLTGFAAGGRYIFSGLDDSVGVVTGVDSFSVGAGQITNLASLGNWVYWSNTENGVIVELDKMKFATDRSGPNGYADITINLQVTAVPEPATAGMMLLGLGLLGLSLRKRQS